MFYRLAAACFCLASTLTVAPAEESRPWRVLTLFKDAAVCSDTNDLVALVMQLRAVSASKMSPTPCIAPAPFTAVPIARILDEKVEFPKLNQTREIMVLMFWSYKQGRPLFAVRTRVFEEL